MIWRDMLIDRRPSDSELLHALAHVFQISTDTVVLFGDYGELLAPEPAGTRLLCERLPIEGEFRMKLGIMPVHPDQEAFARIHDDIDLLSALCRTLAVRGLIDDGSENPYAFLLIDSTGAVSRTDLDAERLDNDQLYVLMPQAVEVGD
jgi:hypothetical protein